MSRLWAFSVRFAFVLALLLVGLVGTPQAAHAGWIIREDTIPADQVIENDVLISGTSVQVDGTVHGDVVAIGSTVTVNGTVQGSLVAVARTVSVNGEIGGSTYVLARTMNLGSSFYVHNNVHFAGLLLDSERGSKIGRDLVAASVRARIGSDIGRGLNAIIVLLSFNGKIGYGLSEEMQPPEPNPTPSGGQDLLQPGAAEPVDVLLYASAGGQKIAGYAAPARTALLSLQAQAKGEAGQTVLPEWLVARLGEFAALLLIGGLIAWLLPSLLRRWVGRLRAKPLPAVGYGALALLIFVNGLAVAILLGAMLVAVGLWLGSVTLWALAFLFWGIGFSLLVLAASLLTLAVFYGSKVIVSYLVATFILERLAPRIVQYRILVLLLGLILFELVRSIPTIGWVIEVIVIVLGLGAIWLALSDKRQPAQPPLAEPESA